MTKRLISLLAVVLSMVFLGGGLLVAQSSGGNEEGENITISPASSKPALKAGQTYSGELKVINNGKIDYTFIAYARPFSVDGNSYQANFERINNYTEVYQWVSFEKSSFDLKAGESVKVQYTIRVPQDARPGGHYAVIFAETQPKEGQSVARKKRVGNLIYGTVDGQYKEAGSLESTKTKTWYTKGPVTSEVLIRNDGNVHFENDTDIVYKNLFGKNVYADRQSRVVMPGTTRTFTDSWEKPPLFGVYKMSGSVKFLDKSENLPTKYIVIMPYWLLALIILIPIVLILWGILKRSKKSQKR